MKRTNLARGSLFPILSYTDSKGYDNKFDSGRYYYDDDDGHKTLWRGKWESGKMKILKGFTIGSQSRGAVKIDLKKLRQQLGILNWWL